MLGCLGRRPAPLTRHPSHVRAGMVMPAVSWSGYQQKKYCTRYFCVSACGGWVSRPCCMSERARLLWRRPCVLPFSCRRSRRAARQYRRQVSTAVHRDMLVGAGSRCHNGREKQGLRSHDTAWKRSALTRHQCFPRCGVRTTHQLQLVRIRMGRTRLAATHHHKKPLVVCMVGNGKSGGRNEANFQKTLSGR